MPHTVGGELGGSLLDDFTSMREKENAARAAAKDADAKGFGSSRLEVSHGLVAMTKDGKVIRWRPTRPFKP